MLKIANPKRPRPKSPNQKEREKEAQTKPIDFREFLNPPAVLILGFLRLFIRLGIVDRFVDCLNLDDLLFFHVLLQQSNQLVNLLAAGKRIGLKEAIRFFLGDALAGGTGFFGNIVREEHRQHGFLIKTLYFFK